MGQTMWVGHEGRDEINGSQAGGEFELRQYGKSYKLTAFPEPPPILGLRLIARLTGIIVLLIKGN